MTNRNLNEITMDDVLNNPLYKDYHEALKFVIKNQDKILFPRKHLMALKSNFAVRLRKLKEQQPEIEMKDALANIFSLLPPKTPREMFVPLTIHLIDVWKKMDEQLENMELPHEALAAA